LGFPIWKESLHLGRLDLHPGRIRGDRALFRLLDVASPRQGSVLLVQGMASLALFAWVLTRMHADFAGRAYAAVSLAWMWWIEGTRPDRWDGIGAVIGVLGALIIIFGPRGQKYLGVV
jgi:drug/metabolite transporter superfamily protein YnfA